jgi:hypothetical protein
VAEGRQRNRGYFSSMIRRVSNPREGLKNQTFLFRSRLVCNSLPHLRRSWNVNCANFRFTEFSELRHALQCPSNTKYTPYRYCAEFCTHSYLFVVEQRTWRG